VRLSGGSLDGCNPMRYDCERQGCFNVKRRPKIEHFAASLPGRIAFSDVDAITEVNGHFLLLEWKGHQGDLPTGQRIMFERMTALASGRFVVLVIVGDPETMVITSSALIYAGRNHGFTPSSLNDVKERIQRWAAWARRPRGIEVA
jgi:hypothetical protein